MLKKVYSIKQKLIEYRYSRQKCIGNIYMFHQVNDDRNQWIDAVCCISETGFRTFINKLIDSGAAFDRLKRSSLETSGAGAESRVFITFDDAYADVYNICYPLLKEKQIPFTVFVARSFLGREGYLTVDMIKEMMASGLCSVGAHTMSHSLLRKLDDESVRYEFSESKKQLEDLLDVQITVMAYPYGSVYACSKSNIAISEETGYEYAFSTINSSLTMESVLQRYFIPRRNVNEQCYKRVLENYCRQ